MSRNLFIALLLVLPASAGEPKRDRFGDPLPDGAIARLGTVHAHPGLDTIAFSADGKTLITTSRHVVRHWDAATGRVMKLIERPAPPEPGRQVISADGRTAVVLSGDHLEIRDAETNHLRQSIPVPNFEDINAFLISYQGNLIVISLDLAQKQGTLTFAVRPELGKVDRWNGVKLVGGIISSDGQRVVATEWVDQKKRMRFRDASGKLLGEVEFDDRPLAFSPDGTNVLAYHHSDYRLVLVDVATGNTRPEKFPPVTSMPYGALSPDGRLSVINVGNGVGLWSAREGKALFRVPGWAEHFAFSPDGKRVAWGDCAIQCWDVETGKPAWPEFGPVLARGVGWRSALARPTDKLIATWDVYSSDVQVWDWTTGQPGIAFGNVWGQVCDVMWFTPDGGRLYALTDVLVYCWDLAKRAEVLKFHKLPSDLVPGAWQTYLAHPAPDGRSFAALAVSRHEHGLNPEALLTRWDGVNGKMLERHALTLNFPELARIAPDGRHVSDRDTLLDVASGRRRTVAAALPHFEFATPPEFTPDGRLCVAHMQPEAKDKPNEVVVWETATGQPLFRHAVGSSTVVRAALSPDDRWLALAAEQKIELWDLATGRLAAELRHHTPDVPRDASRYCDFLMFLPDRKLIVAYGDRTALVWKMPSEADKPPPQRITDGTFTDLASPEPRRAQDAVWALIAEPSKAIALLRERLQPAAPVPAAEFAALVAELDDAGFARRESAVRKLREFGHQIEKPLESALSKATGAEQPKRLKMLLDECRDGGLRGPAEFRAVRAVQALSEIGSAEARALLESWAKGDPAAMLTIQAKAALKPSEGRP